MLAGDGILDFFYWKVPEVAAHSHKHAGASSSIASNLARGDAQLDKVDGVALGKENAQFGNGLPQRHEDVAQSLPLLIFVSRLRQITRGAKSLAQAGRLLQGSEQKLDAILFCLAVK